MGSFDISNLPMDLILNILNIVLLFVIVRALVWKPVKKFMDARTARVNEAAEKSDAKMQEAEEIKAKYESLLRDSEENARLIVDESKKDASAQAEKIISDARENAKSIIEDASQKAEEDRRKAIKNMQNDVVGLAFDISGKLLERDITDDDNRKIADDFFKKSFQDGE